MGGTGEAVQWAEGGPVGRLPADWGLARNYPFFPFINSFLLRPPSAYKTFHFVKPLKPFCLLDGVLIPESLSKAN